jgi:hypothetical protein
MDVSKYPDLLRDKRGPVDGYRFFSRPLFYSARILVPGVICLACIVVDATLLGLHWRQVSQLTAYVIYALSVLLIGFWLDFLNYLRRLRALYLEGELGEVEPGSPIDIALGVAAGGITTGLLFSSFMASLMSLYIWFHAN